MHFLSTNMISFRRSRGIVLVMAAPAREIWTSPVGSEIQRKICEMLGISALKGYQVEALEAICFNKRDTLVCAPTGSRISACFEGMTTSLAEREQFSTASVTGQICIGLKAPPGDVTAQSD